MGEGQVRIMSCHFRNTLEPPFLWTNVLLYATVKHDYTPLPNPKAGSGMSKPELGQGVRNWGAEAKYRISIES